MNKAPIDIIHDINLSKFEQNLKKEGIEVENLGNIKVLRENSFMTEAEVDNTVLGIAQPERTFEEMLYILFHDPRLQFAVDTYVQMILGSGIKIKSEKKSLTKKIQTWFDETNFEIKLEDGLYSYVGAGNMIFEKAPMIADIEEVDLKTIVGAERDKQANITKYVQEVNFRVNNLNPKKYEHFKFSNVAKEIWGRGLIHAIIVKFEDPDTGDVYAAPLTMMKRIEDNMLRISDRYASPTQMFIFEDASDDFIEQKGDELKKSRAGAKIVTNRQFDVKNFEAQGNSKFDGYINHIQRDIIEPGAQFPIQIVNAGFTARASSQTSDSVIIRKVKRIQERLAKQIKRKLIIPYLKAIKEKVSNEDFEIVFEFESKNEVTLKDIKELGEKGFLNRSEIRKHLAKFTTIEIDTDDMDDKPPITSVTPTNKMKPGDDPDTKPLPDQKKPDPEDRKKQDSRKSKTEAKKKKVKKYG